MSGHLCSNPNVNPNPSPKPNPNPNPTPPGHPVVGDVAYTGDRSSPRMMLHAWMLRLPLPKTRLRPHQEPICISSFDPYPAASGAASSGAWGRRGAGAKAAPAVREVAEMEP